MKREAFRTGTFQYRELPMKIALGRVLTCLRQSIELIPNPPAHFLAGSNPQGNISLGTNRAANRPEVQFRKRMVAGLAHTCLYLAVFDPNIVIFHLIAIALNVGSSRLPR